MSIRSILACAAIAASTMAAASTGARAQSVPAASAQSPGSHPAVKRGDLASLTQPTYFVQEAWRHLALGAVLGAVLGPRRAS